MTSLLFLLLLAYAAVAVGLVSRRPIVEPADFAASRTGSTAAQARLSGSPAVTFEPRGLNPNDAPWWDLAALPRLGETFARRIVEHRTERRRVLNDPRATIFRRAEDLQAVHGIGPATVEAIRQHLAFE